jgi:hypothetical protein
MPNKILSVVVVFATVSLILLLNTDITGDVVDLSRTCYEQNKEDVQYIIGLLQGGHITEEQAETRYLAIQSKCAGASITKKFYGRPPSEEQCKKFRYDFKQQVGKEFSEFFQQEGVCENYVPEVERCARSSSDYCRGMQQMLCIPDFKIFCLK